MLGVAILAFFAGLLVVALAGLTLLIIPAVIVASDLTARK